MSWYIWWQPDGEEAWSLALADQREALTREKKPSFITILDANNDFKGEKMSSEELDAVRYRGPLYFDFDAPTPEEAIPQFQRFLNKLKEDCSFDLEQAQLYASGGKGFHCIVPPSCFLPKVNPLGFTHLPHIYKEVALELFVDTLDLRVYSARRGRQFRTANVLRTNGRYKVPITVQEAMAMTPEQYLEVTSAPRHIAPASPPTLNGSLALIFSSAHDKVEKALKGRKKSKVDKALLTKFGGDIPPSILSLMQGVGVVEGVGFQKIATQLAITAHALGKSEEQFLTLCTGLCENHQSDGTRYNTPAKRREELRRMWHYMEGNPCYEFSIGGVKSLVAPDVKTPDLDNGGTDLGDEEAADQEIEYSLTQGMRVSTKGIFKKNDEGVLVKICAVGLANPCQLVDVGSNKVIGYEADIFVDGQPRGREVLSLEMFISRSKFMQFTLSAGGSSMTATDMQVGALADILRSRAEKDGNRVYTTGKEGIDVILLPGNRVDVIWADRMGVVSRLAEEEGEPISYKLVGSLTKEGEYKTDLRSSPVLTDTPESRLFFDQFFTINRPDAFGRMLGWYLACFFNQPIRHIFDTFPLMQVFGPAGSGKTATNRLLASMHYYQVKPVTQSAMEITPFAIEALVSGSGSIPLILDEFKPREMRKDKLDKAKGIMRTNFDGGAITKGRLSSDSGATRLDLRVSKNNAPLVVIGEALESQTALLERFVLVTLNKEGRRGHLSAFAHCSANKSNLAGLGRLCLDRAWRVNFDKLRKEVERNVGLVSESVGDRSEDAYRSVFNIGVVLSGLEFGRLVLNSVFGDRYDAQFETLRAAILNKSESIIPRAMQEASKVLNTLAHMSRSEDEDDKHRLLIGTDYVVNGSQVELRVRNAYTKYVRFSRSLGEDALYDNYEAFYTAMSMYQGVTDKHSIDSLLKDSGTTHVFSISLEFLTDEGVGEFKS